MANTTIYEIAEEAGCSAATVSRVINNYPYVRKATRNKVLKIIEEKGFVPNETARSLVSQSTRLIGILLSDIRTTQHTDGVYYIEHELSKKGYSCIICNTGSDSSSISQYIQLLAQRNVEAVILMGSIYQSGETENAVNQFLPDIPVIICNGSLNGDNIYSIVTNEKDGVYNAVKLLIEKGAKNPQFVLDNETPSNINKMEGYKKGAVDFGYEVSILKVSKDIVKMKEELGAFIKSHPGGDAYIFFEDFYASLSMPVFSKLGLRVPEDVMVVGINNSRFCHLSIKELTSLDNKLYDISLTAVRTVLSLLEKERVNRKVLLFTELIERETTR